MTIDKCLLKSYSKKYLLKTKIFIIYYLLEGYSIIFILKVTYDIEHYLHLSILHKTICLAIDLMLNVDCRIQNGYMVDVPVQR